MKTFTESSKINFKLLQELYHGCANFYIDTIRYNTANDLRKLQNNPYHSQKNFYRQKIFSLTGYYFNNDIAKKIYEDIFTFYSYKKNTGSESEIEEIIKDWCDNNLNDYIESAGRQEIDETYKLFDKIKSCMKKLFKFSKKASI
jgi:hypothetical protein